jgi:hypothetical protein
MICVTMHACYYSNVVGSSVQELCRQGKFGPADSEFISIQELVLLYDATTLIVPDRQIMAYMSDPTTVEYGTFDIHSVIIGFNTLFC